MITNRCREAKMAKSANIHNDLQYIAQLKIKAAHYLLPKLRDHRG